MSRTPDFRDLIGDEGSPEELARLRRVHDLLLAAGGSGMNDLEGHQPADARLARSVPDGTSIILV